MKVEALLASKVSGCPWDNETARWVADLPDGIADKLATVGLIPLFPGLRPHLEAVWEQAEPGTEFAITRYRDTHANLRTQLVRIVGRAGLKPWPKVFQNLRSTRETELEESFPSHVVGAWLGNSRAVAAKHYLQVTEGHYRRAVGLGSGAAQNGAQSASEWGVPNGRRREKPP